MNRRELLHNGLALSAIGSLAPGVVGGRTPPVDFWLVDRQMPASTAIIAAAESSAAKVVPFSADPGTAWMRTLEPALRSAPLSVAGYTNAPVLFCLQVLTRDFGLTLTGLGEGEQVHESLEQVSDTPIDLRDPRFSNGRTAITWLMQPRRT